MCTQVMVWRLERQVPPVSLPACRAVLGVPDECATPRCLCEWLCGPECDVSRCEEGLSVSECVRSGCVLGPVPV